MKKLFNLLAKFLIVSLLAVFFITVNSYAADFTWFEKEYKEVLSSSDIPTPEGSDAIELTESLVLQGLKYVRYFIVVIGILYLTILGFSLVLGGGNEEEVTKAKKGMVFIIVAFVMISMAEDLGEIFRMGENKHLLTRQGIQSKIGIFDFQVELFLTFVYYVIGGYATVMVVRSAIKLITSGGDEETDRKSVV